MSTVSLAGHHGRCSNRHSSTVRSSPVRSSPVRSSPVRSSPVRSSPIRSSISRSRAIRSPSLDLSPSSSSELPPPFCHGAANLPAPSTIVEPNFIWGSTDSTSIINSLNVVYESVVHWKPNLFRIPYGNVGKLFVSELSRLYNGFATSSSLEAIAMKAVTVMPILLLQKPNSKSKTKEVRNCLERRLKSWTDGNFNDLLSEGKTIQSRLPRLSPHNPQQGLARSFANLMFEGKTKAAVRLLSDHSNSGTFHLDDVIDNKSVKDILHDKHPSHRSPHPDSLLTGDPADIHPVLFEAIDASLIRSTALRTTGAAGPSGLDAHCWRRLCSSFKSASLDLCHSLALVARRLCSEFINPSLISPFLASRLIALNKNPGVRPIGIGDTARRFIAKAVLSVLKQDILDVTGSIQLCAGQPAGIEAGIHAVRSSFQDDNVEAILLVDATNAFNSLNRFAALHNIRRLCPSLATILINTYRDPIDLFVDGCVLQSDEGTTQGDPLAMQMYAIATIPLIKRLRTMLNDVSQFWYADDACASGKISQLRDWWDLLSVEGPKFGYFPNSVKSWVVTKHDHLPTASTLFANTSVKVTSEGRPYLGAAIGSPEYISSFVNNKVFDWSKELDVLTTIASSQPHAAYSAFIHGLSCKWFFLLRTIPNIGHLLKPLEDVIRLKLIPSLTGQAPPNDSIRDLLALPARLGGIAISNPMSLADFEYSSSVAITGPLTSSLVHQVFEFSGAIISEQLRVQSSIRQSRQERLSEVANLLRQSLSPALLRAMDLAQEKGSSSWLTSLPIREFGFSLHRGAFLDALALRYNWQPAHLPTHCACGSKFSIEHALSCPKGGFPSIRHNEIRDLTANLLTEVCSDVRIEPDLQPVAANVLPANCNSKEGARLDIAVNGFWGGRYERTYLDVRVFNPYAPSNSSRLSSCYRRHENLKKNQYESRLREVEHSSFTPLVLSATGGMAHEATIFYKRLASCLATKWDQPYSSTMSWLRCRLTFSLLRSAIQCLRGSRSSIGHPIRSVIPPMDLAQSELNLIA